VDKLPGGRGREAEAVRGAEEASLREPEGAAQSLPIEISRIHTNFLRISPGSIANFAIEAVATITISTDS